MPMLIIMQWIKKVLKAINGAIEINIYAKCVFVHFRIEKIHVLQDTTYCM